MLCAGIDFSSNAIDVVLVDLDDLEPPRWDRFMLSGGADAFDRARAVAAAVPGPRSVYWDDVLAIGIEQPQMRGSSMASSYSLYRVQGAVLACLPPATLAHPWLPSSWRSAVGLSGNAKKEAVLDYVVATSFDHGWKTDEQQLEQDACDAYCIALATRNALERQAA